MESSFQDNTTGRTLHNAGVQRTAASASKMGCIMHEKARKKPN